MTAKARRAERLRSALAPEWFTTLAEVTSAGLFLWRDRLLYANPALAELLGSSTARTRAGRPRDLLDTGSAGELFAHAGRFLAGGGEKSMVGELALPGPDGRERWVELSLARIELSDGPAVAGSVIDVSARIAAARALGESESWFRTLAETTSTAIFVFRDRFLYVNPAGASLTGYGVDELLAMDPLDLLHPDYREMGAERRRARLAGEPAPQRYEMLLITRSGEERWIDYTAGTILFEGQVAGLGCAFDITDRKAAEIALRKSEERLNLAQSAARVVTWDWNLLTDELVISQGASRSLGMPLDPPPATTGEFFRQVVHPEDRERLLAAVRRAIRDGQEYSVEHRCLLPEGGVTWLSERGQAIRDETGWVVRMVGVSIDITEQRRAEEALKREQERAHFILASIDDGVIRTDAQGVVEYLNPVAERLTGTSAEGARGLPLEAIYRVVDEATRKPLLNPVVRCLREGRRVILPGERLLLARDGSELAIRDSAAPIRGPAGDLLGAVLAFKDLTAVRDMERAMTHLANHDGLTGLLNRTAFERRLARALEARAAGSRSVALLQVDLAQLKLINDTCGHLAGDELVKQAARQLAGLVGDEHALARLGAEEFGLLLEEITAEEARTRAEGLRSAFESYRFAWQEKSFEVRVGIGLAVAGPGDSVSGLLIAADIACMLAKESGRSRIHEYQADDERLAERYREMHWIHRIYKALERESFRLYCQPVRRLSGEEDGLLGEVLLRMVGDDGELVLPRTFVPAAERYRLMSSIDRWVVRKSFELLAGEATVGGDLIDRLAINLSGESLNDESFLEYVVEQLVGSGVAGSRILFEITETAAIANLPGAMRFISELQRRGACFVLDDFGSGLSSFAYLKNLPVDYLKISSEFIRDIDAVPLQRTLVRSINQVGHELGLTTIAEGVESEEILRVVSEIQLDYAQGYWISPPQPLLPAGG
jgi:diguanylate cyclase (GGDEF)-like protein/PAS domain S-box-containing protein